MYDFANILFTGPCNRFCPWCIGRELPDSVNVDNLNEYPPRNLDGLIARVNEHGVRDVVLTGTVTDPQLYRHEARLVRSLRRRLHADARLSVHTNGVLALRKIEVLNLYDRVCISFPSFVPDTYARLMGVPQPPDLAGIVRSAKPPVKVSCVVNEHNLHEVEDFIARCAAIGVRRVVLRRLFGHRGAWEPLPERSPIGNFKGNPVYRIRGVEVTAWNFDHARCRSLNLFADGTIGSSYLLTRTPELKEAS